MTPNWTSQLAPSHAPPPPGWWPPAPGWWLLAALVLAAAVVAAWGWHDPYRRSRRAALRELRAIRAADADPVSSARAIESLLRRFALTVFGSAQVARLTGDAWLEFVAERGGTPLAGESGRSLLATAFGGGPSDQRECWLLAADAFVRQARRRPPAERAEKR
ncbi:MAG TPA: DUF4381 domain-containing protein [Steroidobacteraceae bacterium]|nr:DUF4381 domain-containing protein [Steroidobacteraceae bacterium]